MSDDAKEAQQPPAATVIKSGWLVKQGHFRKSWKRRFVMITHSMVLYYTKEGGELRGRFFIPDGEVVSVDEREAGRPLCFALRNGTQSLLMQADSAEERSDWERALTEACAVRVLRKGFLLKRGRHRKNWRTRYLVLTPYNLTWFSGDGGDFKGELTLDHRMRTRAMYHSEIQRDHGIEVRSCGHYVILLATTAVEHRNWLESLAAAAALAAERAPQGAEAEAEAEAAAAAQETVVAAAAAAPAGAAGSETREATPAAAATAAPGAGDSVDTVNALAALAGESVPPRPRAPAPRRRSIVVALTMPPSEMLEGGGTRSASAGSAGGAGGAGGAQSGTGSGTPRSTDAVRGGDDGAELLSAEDGSESTGEHTPRSADALPPATAPAPVAAAAPAAASATAAAATSAGAEAEAEVDNDTGVTSTASAPSAAGSATPTATPSASRLRALARRRTGADDTDAAATRSTRFRALRRRGGSAPGVASPGASRAAASVLDSQPPATLVSIEGEPACGGRLQMAGEDGVLVGHFRWYVVRDAALLARLREEQGRQRCAALEWQQQYQRQLQRQRSGDSDDSAKGVATDATDSADAAAAAAAAATAAAADPAAAVGVVRIGMVPAAAREALQGAEPISSAAGSILEVGEAEAGGVIVATCERFAVLRQQAAQQAEEAAETAEAAEAAEAVAVAVAAGGTGDDSGTRRVSAADMVEVLVATACAPVSAALPRITQLAVSLLPHAHTLQCDRAERVCTALGRLRERETLEAAPALAAGARAAAASFLVQWQRCRAPGAHVRTYAAPVDSAVGRVVSGADRSAGVAEGQAKRVGVLDGEGTAMQAGAAPLQEAGAPGVTDAQEWEVVAGGQGPRALRYQMAAADLGAWLRVLVQPVSASGIRGPIAVSTAVGPVEAAPPKISDLSIVTDAPRPGGCLHAVGEYWGGVQGSSEYWWVCIRADGTRDNFHTQPRPIPAHATTDGEAPAPAAAHDPRVLPLTAADVGCRFKVKCRPKRSDGAAGQVVTSKVSPFVVPEGAPLPVQGAEAEESEE